MWPDIDEFCTSFYPFFSYKYFNALDTYKKYN
jgi:hypothetical protein